MTETIEIAGVAYPRHPASELYTSLGVDIDHLRESIAQDGQLEPVVLDAEGAVVDGWQRLTALADLERPPMTATLPEDAEPYRYAAARNVSRRQLTRAQRARVAWRYLGEKALGMKDAEAARLLRVTKTELAAWRDVERVAAKLEDEDGASLIDKVEAGKWPLLTTGRVCKVALGKRKVPLGYGDGDLCAESFAGVAEAGEDDALTELASVVKAIRRADEREADEKIRAANRKKMRDHAKRLGVSKEVLNEVLGPRAQTLAGKGKYSGWYEHQDPFDALDAGNHAEHVRTAAEQVLAATKGDLAGEIAKAKERVSARADKVAAQAKRDEEFWAKRAEANAKVEAEQERRAALSPEERKAEDHANRQAGWLNQLRYTGKRFVGEARQIDDPESTLAAALEAVEAWLGDDAD